MIHVTSLLPSLHNCYHSVADYSSNHLIYYASFQFMGCKLTKDETIAESQDTAPTDMSSHKTETTTPSAATIKSRLERKICIAKETPEPIFDLSECHLKECPSGVFILCKVARKEVLLLHRNQLSTLKGGGQLGDLSLIRILDLRENRLKTLPEEISELVELRVSRQLHFSP